MFSKQKPLTLKTRQNMSLYHLIEHTLTLHALFLADAIQNTRELNKTQY